MKHVAEIRAEQPHVVVLELRRPPFNYLNVELLAELADALERLDAVPDCRAIVLAAEGKAFSAGADFSSRGDDTARDTATFYGHAMRLFRTTKPIVAAVHGAAVGAGLGLAVAADFRVTCAEARFSANFNRLGFHPGFGLSLTLPRLIGTQHAAVLFYTGRRMDGTEAHRIGLADVLVEPGEVRTAALALAAEIAASAPLAVESTRATLRAGLADQVRAVNQTELALQRVQYATEDFKEGVAAMAERRLPVFKRR
jgi:enoyl-CoA hydratase/carnithine racemase